MIEAEKNSPPTVKLRLPAAYFAGCEDVEERRRKLIEALNKGRTPESDAAMAAIAKAYGIWR